MPIVIDKESHMDHGLGVDHVEWMKRRFAEKTAFFVETVELPVELSSLKSGIYGPLAGDPPSAGFYAIRMGRPWPSRLIDKPVRPTRLLTVVAGPGEDESQPCVLYTAYGGPAAPKEPGDFSLGLYCERHKSWFQGVVNRTWEWDDVMDSTWEPGKKDIKHRQVSMFEVNYAKLDLPNEYCEACWKKREEVQKSLEFWRCHAISAHDQEIVTNSTEMCVREWRSKASLFLSKRFPSARLEFTCDRCGDNTTCKYSYDPTCVGTRCLRRLLANEDR